MAVPSSQISRQVSSYRIRRKNLALYIMKETIVAFVCTITFLVIVVVSIASFMAVRGGIYDSNRHSQCPYNSSLFCDIAVIPFPLSDAIRSACLGSAGDPKAGARSFVPLWKSGRTIPTSELDPETLHFYLDEALHFYLDEAPTKVTDIIGTPL